MDQSVSLGSPVYHLRGKSSPAVSSISVTWPSSQEVMDIRWCRKHSWTASGNSVCRQPNLHWGRLMLSPGRIWYMSPLSSIFCSMWSWKAMTSLGCRSSLNSSTDLFDGLSHMSFGGPIPFNREQPPRNSGYSYKEIEQAVPSKYAYNKGNDKRR